MAGITLAESNFAKLEFSRDGATFHVLPFIGDISASGGEAPENDVVTFSGVGKVTGHPRVPSLSITVPSYVPQHSTWVVIRDALIKRKPLTWRITTVEQDLYNVADTMAAINRAGVVTYNGMAVPDFAGDLFGVGMALVLPAPLLFAPSLSTEAAAIATTGVVTFRGTTPDAAVLVVGNIVRVDDTDYVITTAGTSPTVNPAPASAVTASSDYSIYAPAATYAVDAISDTGRVTVVPSPGVAVLGSDYQIVNPSLRLGPFIASVRSAGNFELAAEGNLTTTLELTPRSQLPGWEIV